SHTCISIKHPPPTKHYTLSLHDALPILPKKKNDVQKFTYTRKILPFVEISGWGESVGEHTKGDGTKSSSLHFGTPQKISPIKEGRGYWQYIPNEKTNGTTFLTSYRYEPNYGMLGKVFDAILFRPLIDRKSVV